MNATLAEASAGLVVLREMPKAVCPGIGSTGSGWPGEYNCWEPQGTSATPAKTLVGAALSRIVAGRSDAATWLPSQGTSDDPVPNAFYPTDSEDGEGFAVIPPSRHTRATGHIRSFSIGSPLEYDDD